jgi:hypothetical protein
VIFKDACNPIPAEIAQFREEYRSKNIQIDNEVATLKATLARLRAEVRTFMDVANKNAQERNAIAEDAGSEIARLQDTLRQIQWGNDSIDYAGTVYNLCPLCDQSEVRGHSPDCLVGAALAAPKPEPMPEPEIVPRPAGGPLAALYADPEFQRDCAEDLAREREALRLTPQDAEREITLRDAVLTERAEIIARRDEEIRRLHAVAAEELKETRRLRHALGLIARDESKTPAVHIARAALAAPGAPTPDSALGDGVAGVVPNLRIKAGKDAEPQV